LPQEIAIRRAKGSELTRIRELSVEELPSELDDDELKFVQRAKEVFGKRLDAILTRSGNEFYVAQVGNDEGMAGYVWFGVSQRPFSGTEIGWIYDIFVLPEHRGKGIGEALLRCALKVSKERGFAQTGLMVNAKNKAAWSLYEKLGFQTEYRIMNRKEG
jgi:ribosomal protein S18 acetylase RimI-like enzyme